MPHRSKPSGERTVFSASNVVNTIAEALRAIRTEDDLTYSDIGAVLGKSDDQAAKYCAAAAAMDVVSFARAWREWNGRFAGGLQRLCQDSRPTTSSDRVRGNEVLKAATAMAVALEDADELSPQEIKANRAAMERARDALDEVLRKIVRAA
jgi:hypothetical protein